MARSSQITLEHRTVQTFRSDPDKIQRIPQSPKVLPSLKLRPTYSVTRDGPMSAPVKTNFRPFFPLVAEKKQTSPEGKLNKSWPLHDSSEEYAIPGTVLPMQSNKKVSPLPSPKSPNQYGNVPVFHSPEEHLPGSPKQIGHIPGSPKAAGNFPDSTESAGVACANSASSLPYIGEAKSSSDKDLIDVYGEKVGEKGAKRKGSWQQSKASSPGIDPVQRERAWTFPSKDSPSMPHVYQSSIETVYENETLNRIAAEKENQSDSKTNLFHLGNEFGASPKRRPDCSDLVDKDQESETPDRKNKNSQKVPQKHVTTTTSDELYGGIWINPSVSTHSIENQISNRRKGRVRSSTKLAWMSQSESLPSDTSSGTATATVENMKGSSRSKIFKKSNSDKSMDCRAEKAAINKKSRSQDLFLASGISADKDYFGNSEEKKENEKPVKQWGIRRNRPMSAVFARTEKKSPEVSENELYGGIYINPQISDKIKLPPRKGNNLIKPSSRSARSEMDDISEIDPSSSDMFSTKLGHDKRLGSSASQLGSQSRDDLDTRTILSNDIELSFIARRESYGPDSPLLQVRFNQSPYQARRSSCPSPPPHLIQSEVSKAVPEPGLTDDNAIDTATPKNWFQRIMKPFQRQGSRYKSMKVEPTIQPTNETTEKSKSIIHNMSLKTCD